MQLIRIASVAPQLVAPHLAELHQHIDENNTKESELAAELWSLAGESHEQS
jgi:sRNA-binding carbon storage regulator CsrA